MSPNPASGKEFVVEQESPEGLSGNPSALGERKQPTYTTVGSIYNPDATTPIQPPTRRPRRDRYPPNLQSPIESSLSLQTNLLAVLPVQDASPTSPTPGASRVPQYSQLRQNYDRAVSPPSAKKDNTAPPGFGMSVPSVRSGNLPRPTLGLGIAFEDDREAADSEQDEGVLISDAIFPLKKHFSTASLMNLASFPNPIQEKAKGTLARARSFSRSGSRADSCTSVFQMASESARNRMDSSFRAPSTNSGAPQPLKAGPPGQRQFIPSTFDGVNKALKLSIPEIQPKSLSATFVLPQVMSKLEEGASVPDALKILPTDDGGSVNLTALWSHRSDPGDSWLGCKSPALNDATVPLPSTGFEDKPSKKIHDTLSYEDIRKYYPAGFSPDITGEFKEIPPDWTKEYPLRGNGNPRGPEQQEEKLARINARFYSGTERYIKGINQFQVDNDSRPQTKSIGVIGGERERERYQKRNDEVVRNVDGKIQSRHLSIDEASSMAHSAHVAPLLGMAYVSLMEWKKASIHGSHSGNRWGPHFSQPDSAYLDNRAGGNNSFFSQERPELAKKKKLVKKVRRGY